MDLQTLRAFFMWCTIINAGLLLFWSFFVMLAPGWVYARQKAFFPISRETFNTVIYCFIGIFKIFLIMFNIVPYIALVIIS